jgi:hypothetical protein
MKAGQVSTSCFSRQTPRPEGSDGGDRSEKGTSWPHYYDGKGWEQNPYAPFYGITGIPAMFLLDKSGRLVSTDARGPKLEKEVKEHLGL